MGLFSFCSAVSPKLVIKGLSVCLSLRQPMSKSAVSKCVANIGDLLIVTLYRLKTCQSFDSTILHIWRLISGLFHILFPWSFFNALKISTHRFKWRKMVDFGVLHFLPKHFSKDNAHAWHAVYSCKIKPSSIQVNIYPLINYGAEIDTAIFFRRKIFKQSSPIGIGLEDCTDT